MNYALILAGGTGTRLKTTIPKQYIKVNKKPIICYCIDKFEKHPLVDSIIVVTAQEWQNYIENNILESGFKKVLGFASAGMNRQHSILNGMIKIQENGGKDEDNIIIHDAARPNVSDDLITECLLGLSNADGVMPVLPVKDTIYYSSDSKTISSLLDRDKLFAGQAPESFNFGKYFKINKSLSVEELGKIRGSSEVAYQNGLSIKLITGKEQNYKITTQADLDKFKREMGE